jgi:hypothetical protein
MKISYFIYIIKIINKKNKATKEFKIIEEILKEKN